MKLEKKRSFSLNDGKTPSKTKHGTQQFVLCRCFCISKKVFPVSMFVIMEIVDYIFSV